jgi:uncharacterized membrane protein YqjE
VRFSSLEFLSCFQLFLLWSFSAVFQLFLLWSFSAVFLIRFLEAAKKLKQSLLCCLLVIGAFFF